MPLRTNNCFPNTALHSFRHALQLILCVLVAFSSFSPTNGYGLAENASFTLMIYMTGSTLESEGHAASNDLMEMAESLPHGSGVRLLVQAGGATVWQAGIDPMRATRMELKNGQWVTIEESGIQNMGESKTLSSFLEWGYAFAPAERYGLILWDHGAGPLMGICFDEQYQNPEAGMDSLSLSELEEALQESPFQKEKLLFIGFDACLMCTLEVASLVKPYADYMIASQEVEPASGWNYSFLQGLEGDETGVEWGNRIVQCYAESLKDTLIAATLACLDLRKVDMAFTEFNAFFAQISDQLSFESYPSYTRCRAYTKTLGSRTASDFDLIDLTDLIIEYEKSRIADGAALRKAIDDMITAIHIQNDDHVHGLSLYYPFDNKGKYIASWASAYQNSSFSSTYRAFISKISGYYLGDALFNPKSDYQTEMFDAVGSVRVRMALTEDEAKNFVRSRLIVLEKLASDSYQLVYYDDQHIRVTDREISAKYSGEALYMVDQEENILAGPISYFPFENGISLYAFLYSGFQQTLVRIVYEKNLDGQLVLSQIMTQQDPSGNVFLPASIDLNDYEGMEFISFGPQNSGKGDRPTSLAFSLYYPERTVNMPLKDANRRLAFVPAENRNERFAYFRLTDVQGETICSDVTAIPNYNRISISGSQNAKQNHELIAQLTDVSLITGYDAGLRIAVDLCNQTDEDMQLEVSEIVLETSAIQKEQFDAFRYFLAPKEKDQVTLFIPLKELILMNLPSEIQNGEIVFTTKKANDNNSVFHVPFILSMHTSMLAENMK